MTQRPLLGAFLIPPAKPVVADYSVTIGYRNDDSRTSSGSLELLKEELVHINIGDARKHLLFEHKLEWRHSVIKGRRTSAFISTEERDSSQRIIQLHQEGRSGRPAPRAATNLPRTVLSVVYAAESPTALLARREMQSWRLLQLEPSSLRRPDEFTAPARLNVDGAHLPATLNRLARSETPSMIDAGDRGNGHERLVYSRVANRLSELIQDVRAVWIDRDEKRELLTLEVVDSEGTAHPARALSDGTLRFLALAVLELDSEAQGLLCLEEPENGIHPERIPAMLRLLQDIATDVNVPDEEDNPLRQVIINTHSPAVVAQVPEDSLIVAELKETVKEGRHFKRVAFSCLADTWRARQGPDSEGMPAIARGKLLAYLNPVAPEEERASETSTSDRRRVVDRQDLQPLLPFAK